MRGDARLGAACGLLLLSLVIFSQAGPVNRSSRMLEGEMEPQGTERVEEALLLTGESTALRVGCLVGDVVYQYGQVVPGSSPCERCLCVGDSSNGNSSGVSCQTIQCEVKAGCKALHRADHCCPLYQCECERNGTIYSNGQKLIDLDNPCEVCYCQGGEIVCNQIACFRRNDCEPRYVPGRCCPEYDHCPPSDKDKENHPHSNDSTSILKESSSSSNTENNLTEFDMNIITGINKDLTNNELQKLDNSNSHNSQNINIKEVIYAQDKLSNNEIRIKEILPLSSFDVSSASPKSPTFTREISLQNNSELENIKNDAFNTMEIHEDTKTNDDVSQPPPVLRIGDQLLFLKVGDLVPENSAGSTPSPIFTVIGAEGLQRVVEDPEEGFENRNILSESSNDTGKETLIPSTIESAVETTVESENNDTSEGDITIQDKKVYEENETVTESLDEMLQEAISDLYETTTKNSLFTSQINEEMNSQNDVNSFDTITYNDSYSDSASTYIETYTEAPRIAGKSITEHHLDEEPQPIPIEHLPEHNPEYPPLPEDIMILSMTEDSLESGSSEIDFSGVSPAENPEAKNNEKILIVKRPVIPLSSPTKHYHGEINPEKILPDILPFIRINRTNENSSASTAPEEWLKATEETTVPEIEFNSPLLTLNSALPESILNFSSKNSNEDDDSKEYIFISNTTLKQNMDVSDLNKSEATTDDPLSQTDVVELEGEFRSPGEPLLIPEWERNQTTDEPAVTLNTESNDLYTIISENYNLEQNQTEERENSNYNIGSFGEHLISESTTEYETISSGDIQPTSEIKFSSTELTITNITETLDTRDSDRTDYPTDDTITNFIISTEYSSNIPSTENTPIQYYTGKPTNLMSEVIRDPEFININGDVHPQKQKKTSALMSDVKTDSGKKHNILADLINLVGDVASIGNHDIEVSTVQNSIETHKSKDVAQQENVDLRNSPKDVKPKETKTDIDVDNVEITEYDFSGDMEDAPLENEKVEFTTKKTYIDKDTDERNKWKSTDDIVKDIEIIPKVENKISKKNPSKEKIIDEVSKKNINTGISNIQPVLKDTVKTTTKATYIEKSKESIQTKNEDVIIYTTVQPTTASPVKEINEDAPKKIKLSMANTNPETLISIDSIESTTEKDQNNRDVQTTENSYTSTVMKVSGRHSNIEEQINSMNSSERDKLTKRETNSQLTDAAGQIDDSLISILRGFFEQHFNH